MSGEHVAVIVIGFAIVGLVLGLFVFWIAMLVNAAKRGAWVWFILTFMFPLLALLYWLVSYEKPDQHPRVVYVRDDRREPTL